jgi:hypothetical protein
MRRCLLRLRECKSTITIAQTAEYARLTCYSRLIVLAVFALCVGHPGLVQDGKVRKVVSSDEEGMSERKHNVSQA